MRIIYAPDKRAEALARTLAEDCRSTDGASPEGEKALLLVTTDYYSRALWRMKGWLTDHAAALEEKLCACLVLCDGGGGGELAIRSLVSQLMAAGCAAYLCAVACADGRIRPGGCAESCTHGMTSREYYTKLLQMAAKFG